MINRRRVVLGMGKIIAVSIFGGVGLQFASRSKLSGHEHLKGVEKLNRIIVETGADLNHISDIGLAYLNSAPTGFSLKSFMTNLGVPINAPIKSKEFLAAIVNRSEEEERNGSILKVNGYYLFPLVAELCAIIYLISIGHESFQKRKQ